MFIHIDNLNRKGFAYEVVQGLNKTNITLRKGNKAAQRFDSYDKTGFVRFFTYAFDKFIRFECGTYFFPIFDFLHAYERYDNRSFFFDVVSNFYSQFLPDLNEIARLFGSRNSHFLLRQNGFGFRTDGNIGRIIIHRNNRTGYHVALLRIFFVVVLIQ